MQVELRKDLDPDPEFYYRQQFEIYHEPYLIWDRETWEAVLATCTVCRIEVNGEYAGDVIWEDKGKGSKHLVDFALLPEYQGKGIGKTVLEMLKGRGGRLTAVTRNETLGFFLKSGFAVDKKFKNYYGRGVTGFSIRYSDMGAPPVRQEMA